MKIKGIYRMPGSRYLWYRWLGHDGKRRAVSLKTDDLSEAIKAARRIQDGELIMRWEHPEPAKTAATKLVESYLTMAQERDKKPMRREVAKTAGYILRKYLVDMEIQDVTQITRGSIKEWVTMLKNKEDASKDTVHKYARTLKTFVKYLVSTKLVGKNLLDDFDVPEPGAVGRKNWLKVKEVQRVIGEVKDDDTLRFVLFSGFHAGLRKNEIANAKVGWFDLEAKLVHIQNDPKSGFILKDKDNRSVPLTNNFSQFLHGFLANRKRNDYAIAPAKSQGTWRYRYDFSRAWKTHMKRCGVTCTIHDSRRSFASNLVSAGESIYIVARWLGDGVQVVERSYGHLAPSAGNINRLA